MLDRDPAAADYDYDSHWITERCDRGLPGLSAGPFLTGLMTFALPWNVVWIAYAVTQWDEASPSFLVALGLLVLWVDLAPGLVWTYDRMVLPQFFDRFRELNTDRDALNDIARRYNEFFARPRLLPSLFWGAALLVVAWAGTPVLVEQGMTGSGGVFRWLTYAFAGYVGAVLAGPGFTGSVTTLLMIREVAELDFDIQPMHPDQLGGLSNVGYCAIRTTLLYSTASLFFPLAFELAAGSARGDWIVAIVLVYVLTILASFLYPTLKINRHAAAEREEILAELRDRTWELQSELAESAGDEVGDVATQLEFQRVRAQYEDYRDLRLYPMQVDIFVRLAASVLLPVLMLALEYVVLGSG